MEIIKFSMKLGIFLVTCLNKLFSLIWSVINNVPELLLFRVQMLVILPFFVQSEQLSYRLWVVSQVVNHNYICRHKRCSNNLQVTMQINSVNQGVQNPSRIANKLIPVACNLPTRFPDVPYYTCKWTHRQNNGQKTVEQMSSLFDVQTTKRSTENHQLSSKE